MRVLVLLACVALAAAQDGCGPLQRLKIKHQWSEIFAAGATREEFSREFWTE